MKSIKVSGKTIVITDPCYLMKHDSELDDWDRCSYGAMMFRLGINPLWVERTGVGDGCWEIKGGEPPIGKVSADSGQVGCFLLDEVLAYNPGFMGMPYFDELAVVIRNFTGEMLVSHRKSEFGMPLVLRIEGSADGFRKINGTTDFGWEEPDDDD